MRILHLVDDEKFIDIAIDLFEKVDGIKNDYLLGLNDEKSKRRYIKSDRILEERLFSNEYKEVIYAKKYDLIVVHYLDYAKSKIIANISKDVSVLWLMWGGDFYNTPFFKDRLYQKYTSKLLWDFKRKSVSDLIIRPLISKMISYVFPRKGVFSVVYRKAVERIDYCATVIPSEFLLLQKLPFFKAQQVFFSYGALDDMLTTDDKVSTSGNNILIGNSSTPESNQIDVFYRIKALNLTFDKVIVPLSYGNYEGYKEEVCEVGEKLFADKFHPLLGFLPMSEYTLLLKECRFAVFNHNRQQAVGNIVMMLYLGAKVFLSEHSPVYKFYKSLGIIVFNFQHELNSDNLQPLNDDQIKNNRELIFNYYNSEVIALKVRDTILRIQDDLERKTY